ncbi:hypothetical protein PV356_35290 [Streptomyces sp. WI03-5b]|uniref:hypothetical protein n=1 Tax=Streptomyces sp. WI03-5b TaxID=462946 RepID=UPI0029B5DF24|nr:hypothetical protein [Streptomyces sp. WI03-5b]MDX2624686.1 hypothetical protein [Streptomyces sp. WI03-5b]
MSEQLQPSLAAALLALVPGAQASTTRVTVEHHYTQLDVQSVDSWSGGVDGLACRIAEHLRTTPAAPEKGTPADTGAELTPGTVLVAIARALREQPTGAQLLQDLDQLGEAVVSEDTEETAAWVAVLCHLVGLENGAPAPFIYYRAEHDSIVAGRYTTAAEAQRHCEVLVSREYPETASVIFEWCVDKDEPDEGGLLGLELDVRVDGEHASTGYTVTPITVAAAYDPDADE